MKSVRGAGFASWTSFVLPVLLSLLPLLFLVPGSHWERQCQDAELRQQWRERTDQSSKRLIAASIPDFWVERSLHRIVSASEQALSHLIGSASTRMPSEALLSRILGHAKNRTRMAGMPASRIWAISLAAPDNGDLLRGPGLESDLRYVVTRLLRELGRNGTIDPPDFERGQWPRLLEQLFGFGVSGDLFMAEMRGRSFPVIFQAESRTACWEFVMLHGRPVAVLLLVSALRADQIPTALRLSLRHWRRLEGKGGVFPAILPLPRAAPAKTPRVLLASALKNRIARGVFTSLQHDMQVVPGMELEAARRQGVSNGKQLGRLVFGQIRLPVKDLGVVLSDPSGSWWYRLFPLSPSSMSLGCLMSPIPRSESGPMKRAMLGWVWVVLGFWTVMFLIRVFGGVVPTLSVRWSLIVWFLGLVALPVSLAVVTGAEFSADLRRNLLDDGFSRLDRMLQDVEGSSAGLSDTCLRVSKSLLDPSISGIDSPKELYEIQFAGRSSAPFLEKVWSHYASAGLDLTGCLAFGHQGFCRSRFAPSMSHRSASASQFLTSNLVQSYLNAEITETLRKRGIKPVSPPLGRVSHSNPELFRLGSIYQLGIGSKNLLGYFDRFHYQGDVWHFFLVLWEREKLFGEWLSRWVRVHRPPDGSGLAVFRPTRNHREIIAGNGDSSGLDQWVPGTGDEEIRRETGNRLILSRSSRLFPGFRFVAAMSSDWIRQQMDEEQHRRFLQLLLLIAMVGLAGWLLSAWLASPVERMTQGLQRVAAGSLVGRLDITRNDELGRAAGSLDTMTGWLRERVKMSRFVAPQVLDVVAGGDISKVTRGSSREVVILVSDLRSFTTMTETRSPEDVFCLLNGHLELMTKAIQDAGGVIDRFIGDAIQAVFYDAGPARESRIMATRQALRAARNMVSAHRKFNGERVAAGSFSYEIGIGIDLGPVVTGVLGDPESRLDFTVLGEPIQQAAEYEAASKYGSSTRIVCSEEIKRLNPDEPWLALPAAQKGWELAETGDHVAGMVSRGDNAAERLDSIGPIRDVSKVEAESPLKRRGLGMVIPLLLWALPIFLIGATFQSLNNELQQKSHESERLLLMNDLKLMKGSAQPEIQFAMYLHREMERLGMNTGEGPGKSDKMCRGVKNLFSRACTMVPSLGWVILRPRSDLRTDSRTQTSGDWRVEDINGSIDLLASEAGPAFTHLSAGMLYTEKFYDPELSFFADQTFQMIFGSHGRNTFHFQRRAFGQFAQVVIRGKPRLLSWNLLRHLPRWNKAGLASHTNLLDSVEGGIILTLDPADLTPELTGRLLIENARVRGTVLEIPGIPSSTTVPLQNGTIGSASDPDRVHGQIDIALDGNRCVSAFRTVPVSNRLIGWRRLLCALGIPWLLIILVWHVGSDRLPWGLSGRLAAAFVGVLLPAVLFAGLLAERRQIERESRLEGDALQGIRERLGRFDDGFSLCTSAYSAVLDGELNAPDFQRELYRLESDVGVASAGDELLLKLHKRLLRNGLAMGVSRLVSRAGRGWDFSESKGRDERDLMWEYQYLVSKRLLGSLNPGSSQIDRGKSENQEMLIGAQIEELTSILRIILDPANFARLFFSPFSVEKYWDTEISSTLFVKHLRREKAPSFLFNVSWAYHNELFLFLENSRSLISQPLPGRSGIGMAPLREPFLCFDTPSYLAMGNSFQSIVTLDARLTPLDPRTARGNLLAAVTGEQVADHIGDGDEQTLFLSYPARQIAGMNLFGQAELGRERFLARRQLFEERLWLLAIMFFTLILARGVARRFTAPLFLLTAGTERIMAGDFAVRLPVDRDDEFGQLAQAFNAMAVGVEEGRLLSRFVSDSVRQTARDEEREAAARRGEAVSAVVLFAGLSQFKHLLTKVEPELLIENLNRYLETMAREIRAEGGMIDKFIGDKILAVFFTRDHGGETAAMAAAIRTSRKMLASMAHLEGDLPSALGIGLTAGTVLAGIMGTAEVRLESTVIGDPVNLASRLCDVARSCESGGIIVEATLVNILCAGSDATLAQEAARAERLEVTRVKGKIREIEIYAWPRGTVDE